MASISTTVVLGAKDNVSPALRKAGAELSLYKRKIDGFSASLRGALSVGAGVGFAATLVQIGQASLDAQMQLERLGKSYESIFGQAAAGPHLEYMLKTSNELGLSFVAAAEGAKSFFAAGQGTTLALEMDRIFEAVSTAGAALQLTSDDIHATFIALGQVISKGKVQAEELRGQLGERLPGAFQLAAKAMGMTTAELDKFMADGKLTAEDLLPKLARVLEETYAKGAENAANSIQASINRMDNAWTIFKSNIVNSDAIVTVVNRITDALNGMNAASLQADARQKAIAALKAEGVKPAALLDVDPSMAWMHTGANLVNGGFSEAQIQAEMNFQKMQAQAEAYWENWERSQAAALEKATGDMSQVINATLKNTYEYQLRELENQRAEALQKIRTGIDAAVREGSSAAVIAQLEADFEAVKKVYEQKLADLKKKHAPKSGGGSSGRGSAGRGATQGGNPLSADWGNAAGDLQATRDALKDVEKSEADLLEELDRDPYRAMLHYSREWAEETKHMGLEVADVLTGAFDSAADALADFVVTGKFNFADFTNSILTDLARIAARQALGGIVGGLVGSIGKLFGGGAAGGTTTATNAAATAGNMDSLANSFTLSPFRHSGGMAWEAPTFTRLVPEALFANAPRFHSGRYYDPAYELPAIIRRDESVLTPGQMRAIAGAGSPAPEVTVNIHNSTGQQASQSVSSNPGGGKTIDVWVGDMAAKQMATPGSRLAKTVAAQTGRVPQAIRR